MTLTEQLRSKFDTAYRQVLQEAPQDLVKQCNTSLEWEQDFVYPHIDPNLVKGLPEPLIDKLVNLYEHLRLQDL